jgi:hypothetical protein
VVVRCTRRMLDLLGGRSITLSELPATDDDRDLNLLWIDRQKCLPLTHAGTLFSVFRRCGVPNSAPCLQIAHFSRRAPNIGPRTVRKLVRLFTGDHLARFCPLGVVVEGGPACSGRLRISSSGICSHSSGCWRGPGARRSSRSWCCGMNSRARSGSSAAEVDAG